MSVNGVMSHGVIDTGLNLNGSSVTGIEANGIRFRRNSPTGPGPVLLLAAVITGTVPVSGVVAGEVQTVSIDPATVPSMARPAGDERPFLPTPLAKPVVLPQREGPGVVVSTARTASGAPLRLGPSAEVVGADGAGRPLTLAHYAFGAYQRGLYGTAFDVALMAAAEDDADAAALVGRLYEEALGVERDAEKAAGWYAMAADLGNTRAKTRLGIMMLEGRGLPKDTGKAADALKAAAEEGDAEASYRLGLMALEGVGGERDAGAAFRHMLSAAEAGHVPAQGAVAGLYEAGQGTVPDDVKATHWYGRAARAGAEEAMLRYATRLFNGIGTEADEATAARFFAAAARDGDPVAMNRYARLLANGRGVEPNAVEAIKWHLLARRAGVSDFFLDGFMGTADPSEVTEAKRRAKGLTGG